MNDYQAAFQWKKGDPAPLVPVTRWVVVCGTTVDIVAAENRKDAEDLFRGRAMRLWPGINGNFPRIRRATEGDLVALEAGKRLDAAKTTATP